MSVCEADLRIAGTISRQEVRIAELRENFTAAIRAAATLRAENTRLRALTDVMGEALPGALEAIAYLSAGKEVNAEWLAQVSVDIGTALTRWQEEKDRG